MPSNAPNPAPHKCVAITVTQPAAWLTAFQTEATKAGQNLSQWLGECGRDRLPAKVRAKLPERPAGRPRKES